MNVDIAKRRSGNKKKGETGIHIFEFDSVPIPEWEFRDQSRFSGQFENNCRSYYVLEVQTQFRYTAVRIVRLAL